MKKFHIFRRLLGNRETFWQIFVTLCFKHCVIQMNTVKAVNRKSFSGNKGSSETFSLQIKSTIRYTIYCYVDFTIYHLLYYLTFLGQDHAQYLDGPGL